MLPAARDIRSESLSYKRDNNHKCKWEYGTRPLHGMQLNHHSEALQEESSGGADTSHEHTRPKGPGVQHFKTHANKTSKPHGITTERRGRSSGRVTSMNEAKIDASEGTTMQLSSSLLALAHNHDTIGMPFNQLTMRDSAMDSEILYSFDYNGPSPGDSGRKVDLSGLIERAEQRWDNKQTEMIVKGEYEVLDIEGETTILNQKKKKASPKRKAFTPSSENLIEEDGGFELI